MTLYFSVKNSTRVRMEMLLTIYSMFLSFLRFYTQTRCEYCVWLYSNFPDINCQYWTNFFFVVFYTKVLLNAFVYYYNCLMYKIYHTRYASLCTELEPLPLQEKDKKFMLPVDNLKVKDMESTGFISKNPTFALFSTTSRYFLDDLHLTGACVSHDLHLHVIMHLLHTKHACGYQLPLSTLYHYTLAIVLISLAVTQFSTLPI